MLNVSFVNDELVYCLFIRPNRHTQWRYATYCGRYATAEDAIAAAQSRYDHCEYRIEEIGGDFVDTGAF